MIDTAKIGYLQGNSQAKNIMIKYMKENGIKNINSLIITHFDADHSGGTIDLLEEINVNKLYITDAYENTQLSEKITDYIKENKVTSEIFSGTSEIYNKDDFIITLIKPEGEKLKTENQKSLITHIKYKDKNFLFMGDGDIETYNILPDKYKKDIDYYRKAMQYATSDEERNKIQENQYAVIRKLVNQLREVK